MENVILRQQPVRKTNPTIRWHLSDAERREIRRLTIAGVRQSEIARRLRIGRDSVSKAQRAMGLPTRLVIPEQKIMELFRRGWGGYRISKHLHVPANQVYAVAHKNNFRRADGAGYPTPKENERCFIEAVKNRDNYIKHLAKKCGVGICKAHRLAREVLATPRFRPGASKPALSSDFPQRHFDPKMATPDHFVELVQRVCQVCFNGKLPATDDARFVAAIMSAIPCLEGQPQPVLDSFATGLVTAIDCLRRQQVARWQN